jgi:hypothetical protein
VTLRPRDYEQGSSRSAGCQGRRRPRSRTWRHESSVTTRHVWLSVKPSQRSSSRKRPGSSRRHAATAKSIWLRAGRGTAGQVVAVRCRGRQAGRGGWGSSAGCSRATRAHPDVAHGLALGVWLPAQVESQAVEEGKGVRRHLLRVHTKMKAVRGLLRQPAPATPSKQHRLASLGSQDCSCAHRPSNLCFIARDRLQSWCPVGREECSDLGCVVQATARSQVYSAAARSGPRASAAYP